MHVAKSPAEGIVLSSEDPFLIGHVDDAKWKGEAVEGAPSQRVVTDFLPSRLEK